MGNGDNMEPKVTLIDFPRYPIETIYSIWQASKSLDPLMEPLEIRNKAANDPEFNKDVMNKFFTIIRSKIPVLENLNFTFILENVSISFREQMVRHRIGIKVGDMVGVDIVPDLHMSSWWSQTMRVMDVGNFAEEKRYR